MISISIKLVIFIVINFSFDNFVKSQNITITCGKSQQMLDECFKDLPEHLMEFLQSAKIALTEKDIASKCTVFRKGMSCFDKYTKACLAQDKIALFQNNVAGANKFLNKICDDRRFQANYLRHKDCFLHIQDDWRKCTKKFQNILVEELHGPGYEKDYSNKFMQFCCSRHAYENCIFTSAKYKCYKNSAKFVKDTAMMLSDEKQFSNCRQYETALCNFAKTIHINNFIKNYFLFILVVIIIYLY